MYGLPLAASRAMASWARANASSDLRSASARAASAAAWTVGGTRGYWAMAPGPIAAARDARGVAIAM